MFVAPADVEINTLRQGDILDAVPFPILDAELALLGRIDHDNGVQLPHPKIIALPREHRNQKDCVTAQVKMRLSPAAVLAHCCELELRHGKCTMATIPVARLIPVKPSIAGDLAKIASLRGNKDPRNADEPGYIDYFYLTSDGRLSDCEWVVDYSQISSIPGTEYASLLRRKVLQLTDRERVKFKIKLAAYLGSRLTDEEIDLGLTDPWATAPKDGL